MLPSLVRQCVGAAVRYGCRQPSLYTPVRSMFQTALPQNVASRSLCRPLLATPPPPALSAASAGPSVQCRAMTLRQKVQKPSRRKKPVTKKLRVKRPQYKGVVLKVLCLSPKKPNSGQRKVVRIRLTYNNKIVLAYVPGIGHTLQEHQMVLVHHGKVPDLSGVHLKCIRGKYDLKHVQKVEKK